MMPKALKILLAGLLLFTAVTVNAQSNAKITASNLKLEESEDGITLILEGPVRIDYGSDLITADSGSAKLKGDLESLDKSLESVELGGNINYTGAQNTSASADQATYYAQQAKLVLSDGPILRRGDTTVRASTITYEIRSNLVRIQGNCNLRNEPYIISADACVYYLDSESGNLTGNVEIKYIFNDEIFDEHVSDIYLNSDSLEFSVEGLYAITPESGSGGATTIRAGSHTLTADTIRFFGSESGLTTIEAHGNIVFEGPNKSFRAENISLDTLSGVISADGGDGLVEFTILGQSGTAKSIEVNFQEHWSIRLVGGSVGGEIETPENNPESTDE